MGMKAGRRVMRKPVTHRVSGMKAAKVKLMHKVHGARVTAAKHGVKKHA